MESRTLKFLNLEQFFSGTSKLASCGKETLWLIHCHRVPPQGCDVDPNAIWGGGGDPGESSRAQTLILPRRDKIKGSSFRAARTLRHHVEWRSRVLVVRPRASIHCPWLRSLSNEGGGSTVPAACLGRLDTMRFRSLAGMAGPKHAARTRDRGRYYVGTVLLERIGGEVGGRNSRGPRAFAPRSCHRCVATS